MLSEQPISPSYVPYLCDKSINDLNYYLCTVANDVWDLRDGMCNTGCHFSIDMNSVYESLLDRHLLFDSFRNLFVLLDVKSCCFVKMMHEIEDNSSRTSIHVTVFCDS